MKKIPIALTLCAAIVVLLSAGCAALRIEEGRKLAKASRPFSTSPAGATAKMLVIGDSTGEGTGASAPELSLPGRLARRFPRLAIENRSQDGARLTDVLRQWGDDSSHYDVILVQAGGNDVIGFTSADNIRRAIDEIAHRATARAPFVILMPAGNVGNAPFFFPPLTWLMTARSRTLHALVREAARQTGAVYVNLFKEKADDPFAKEPQRLHAADGLHPSDDGYALWESELLAQSGIAGIVERPSK